MHIRYPLDPRLRVYTQSARKQSPPIRVALKLRALCTSEFPSKRATPTRLQTHSQAPTLRALNRPCVVPPRGGHEQELRPGSLRVAHALPGWPTRPGNRPGPTKRDYPGAPRMLECEMPLLDGSNDPQDGREDLEPAGLPTDGRRRNPTPSGRGRRHNVGAKVAEEILSGVAPPEQLLFRLVRRHPPDPGQHRPQPGPQIPIESLEVFPTRTPTDSGDAVHNVLAVRNCINDASRRLRRPEDGVKLRASHGLPTGGGARPGLPLPIGAPPDACPAPPPEPRVGRV